MGLVSSSVVRGLQRTRPMTSTSPVEESNGEGLRCGTAGSWDSGRDLGVTERSPTGRLTLWDQREAGTWVHRSRKEA